METKKNFNLLFFSIFTGFISYGFALTNMSLGVDDEVPVTPWFSLNLGRWGTNLIRYYIFEGHFPYFTLLLSLILLAFAAVELSKLLKFKGVSAYVFCALFLTFPQLAYQLVFTMQADVIGLGFLLSVLIVILFQKCSNNLFSLKSILLFLTAALLYMFVIASYQGLIIVPVIIYLLVFFQSTYLEEFKLKGAIIKLLYFFSLVAVSASLYILSNQIIGASSDSFLSSYTSGSADNQFLNGCSVWLKNLVGSFYYGNTTFVVATALSIFLFVRFFIEKKIVFVRFLSLFALLLIPFIMSFFITNSYYPPRLFLTSGIVFAFIIAHASHYFKNERATTLLTTFICITNIFFITQLFYSSWRISNHDKEVAKNINFSITNKYPEFNERADYVYFYGALPLEDYDKFKLKNSEVFGGSLFNWDNGSNERIINLFRCNDIAYYRAIDNKETYKSIKDSISNMPIWPDKQSIKKVNNVIIVKLGKDKGSALWGDVEQ